ncbi:MAG TPA: beta-ketoacyl-ACP synthase III [Oceanicaulis sp.]|jgi:beta-ketodecanoyl-[acyl-carrier-protein] synthase|uniref:Beta-ketoacyl-ACP synthase III n=1 Tax=Glycocaulis albus TaxID=1382801 RepID=A0ABQ1XSR1_9PROT|nr:beta-ketoacyl-ACP synthase III [Glycocaulis albus]MBV5259404.1 beta-ketoacyl-ACP synthase III [Synechococcus moorigangaii CMS01]GGH01754.1 beta-ketoacyl-ACP synthase III [Glycocaulis albus]HCY55513.1 beta-ketoacyl-ACP synthase III [Oceanicaulis sp.]
MSEAVIRATGLWTPPHSISNEELVAAYNAYAERYNAEHADEIARGELEALTPSSAEFIEKASGIKSRYVVEKDGVLDISRMMPNIPERSNDELAILAEIGAHAARDALERAGRTPADIDGIIVAASNMQRAYPAVAIEIQMALGMEHGFGFDMNVACSSATFGMQAAADMIAAGNARAILVVSPEITSAHLNWRDRDSHFIFGDVATAVLLERAELGEGGWRIIGSRLKTQFSNNIRNNFGFLNRTERATGDNRPLQNGSPKDDRLFVQEGRKVFKEVVPMVSDMIREHMDDLGLEPDQMRRVWLHQANINMNLMIAKKVFGREAGGEDAPTILDEYANTSSAGSIIAFHKHSEDLQSGDKGVICSFGAGYSAGTVFVEKL